MVYFFLTKTAARGSLITIMPNPENDRERGTQVFGAYRHSARGNLIGPSPSANLAGFDEENLRN